MCAEPRNSLLVTDAFAGCRKVCPGLVLTIAPALAGIVGLRMPQYLLYNGLGTILWVGSGIGLGYAFSDQLEQAVSVVAHLGPTMVLILLGRRGWLCRL